MRIALKIAVRFLKSSRGQTILIAVGIAIGISVQIFIGSLIQGLQKSLVESTIGNSSQITILGDTEDELIEDYENIMTQARSADSRISKIAPALDQPGFIITESKTRSVLLRGFDLAASNEIYDLSGRLVEGQLPDKDYQALIGTILQEELGLAVGDSLEITTGQGLKQDFVIAGVVDLKVAALNKSWMITTLGSVQKLFSQAGKVTSIEMQVADSDVFIADEIGAALENIDQNDVLKITNWKEQNESLLSGLNGQSVSSLMIQVFVVISVVLAIASVLAISVLQKSRQIGILKAMGIKSRQASLVFFFQGFILGVIGGILGVGLGLGLAVSFTTFAVRADGTPVVALFLDPGFFALSFGIAVAASSLASLIPARRSAKLDPIEVIRNG